MTPEPAPLDLFDETLRSDPHRAFAELRSACPVAHHAPTADLPEFWAVSTAELALEVLRTPAVWSSKHGPGLAHTGDGSSAQALVDRDPPEHTFQRRLINKAFTPRAIAELEPRIESLVTELLDDLEPRGRCELVDDYADHIPLRIMAEMLGVPVDTDAAMAAQFRRWVEIFTLTVANQVDFELFRSEFRLFREYWHGHLSARRAQIAAQDPSLPADLLTRLLTAELDGVSLTDKEIVGFILFLLVAGTGTTTLLISNLVHRLIERPDQLALLREQPERWEVAVEESLRFDAPVHGLCRTPNGDQEVAGVVIPDNAKVMVLYGAANHDPDYWERPGEFDVTRDPAEVKRHFAFGSGIHLCLGAPLARMEGRIAVQALFERFRGLRFGEGEQVRHESAVLWGFRQLPIAWDPA